MLSDSDVALRGYADCTSHTRSLSSCNAVPDVIDSHMQLCGKSTWFSMGSTGSCSDVSSIFSTPSLVHCFVPMVTRSLAHTHTRLK